MDTPTIMELKRTAGIALYNYRMLKKKLLAHEQQGEPLPTGRLPGLWTVFDPAQARGWIAAIDGTRTMLRRVYPRKEQFLSLCFGLDAPKAYGVSTHSRMLRLAVELHVSQSTLYKWREEALLLTLLGAVEAGVLHPLGLPAEPEAQKNTAAVG